MASFFANKQRHAPGPPMTLGNMREQGVQHLIAYCLNDACRHQALIDMSNCPDGTQLAPLGRGWCAVQ
jgi:hypothetical protein